MAFESLTSELSLDASGYVGEMEDAAGATEGLADSAADAERSLLDINASGLAAGGGMAAAGTGAQGLLDDTQSLRESLGRTAETMGMSTDEANSLARSLSDATFDLEDVTATMDILARQGIETEEEMENVAVAMDMMADATGSTAASIANSAGPALRAFGHDLEDTEEHMDTFTFVARNTTMDIEEFSGSIERMAPEIREAGLSLDETAMFMAALEDQGITGRQAINEFRSAIEETDGEQGEMLETLGLTEQQLHDQSDALDDAQGSTEELGESANDSLSTWDSLRSRWDDAKLAASGMLGPINSVAPAMQSAGIAAMAMSTINFSAVIPSMIGVATAAAPVLIPLLAITAAVGALYLAWDNNIFGIRDIANDAFDTIIGIVESVSDIIPGSIEDATDAALDIFTTWHPAGIVWDKRDEIMDALPSVSDFRDHATSLASGFIDGIRDSIPDVGSAVSDLGSSVRDRLPGSDAKTGPLSDLTDASETIPQTLADKISDGDRDVSRSTEGMAAEAVPGGGGAGGRARRSVGLRQEFERALTDTDRTDDVVSAIDDLIRVTSRLGDELDVDVQVDRDSGRYDPF